jgi:hypothetical protein
MKKDFIVSKIETSQDGNPFVYLASTDPHNPKSAGGDENSCFPSSSSVTVISDTKNGDETKGLLLKD